MLPAAATAVGKEGGFCGDNFLSEIKTGKIRFRGAHQAIIPDVQISFRFSIGESPLALSELYHLFLHLSNM